MYYSMDGANADRGASQEGRREPQDDTILLEIRGFKFLADETR